MLPIYTLSFDGKILTRGFWLYIWKITSSGKTYLYVGRTGESSSANAASPFTRVSRHLDFRANAKGNSLARRLDEKGVAVSECRFEMISLGPIFAEQEDFPAHRPYRDKMATLEFEAAAFLRELGFDVLGIHRQGSAVEKALLSEVKTRLQEFVEKEGATAGGDLFEYSI